MQNYIDFAEFLILISKSEYDQAKEKLTDILKISSGDVLVMNNLALMNFYLNKVVKCHEELHMILDRDQMNCYNDLTYYNINLMGDCINLPKYIHKKN